MRIIQNSKALRLNGHTARKGDTMYCGLDVKYLGNRTVKQTIILHNHIVLPLSVAVEAHEAGSCVEGVVYKPTG